jgi:hypothetical protein
MEFKHDYDVEFDNNQIKNHKNAKKYYLSYCPLFVPSLPSQFMSIFTLAIISWKAPL